MPAEIRQPLFKLDGFDAQPPLATAFGLYRDSFSASCVRKEGAHCLEVWIDRAADDQRPTPPYRSSATEGIGFGLHISDFNLVLDDLIEAVRLQAAAR